MPLRSAKDQELTVSKIIITKNTETAQKRDKLIAFRGFNFDTRIKLKEKSFEILRQLDST